jgi:tetratricopeptide (TPR) repeat protein
LSALRAGRDIARRGGDDIDALEDADEKFAMAIKSFEGALKLNPTPGAEGNLGNAHLARGRVQAVLAELAMDEAREARRAGMNAGLEGTAEMYLELAEENLIQAGRRFRVAASGMQSNGEESSAGIKGRAKALTGWGAALSLRSELVLSSQGDVADAESLVVAAVEKFKAAAAIEPDSPTIYVSWGDAMRMCASLGTVDDEDERLRQAEGCYREALRLDPECVPALDGLEELL